MNRQVNVILALKDKFSAPLLKAADTVDSLDKKTYDGMRRTNKIAKDIHKGFGRGLKNLVKWGKRAAITVGTISLKKGMDGVAELDAMSRKVKSIAGDKLDLSYIKDQLLEIRKETGKTFQEIGDSWYNAISASVPIEQSIKAVEKAYKLSVAGFTTEDSAMNLLATTMNTFGLQSEKDMDRIADIFLQTQNRGIILVDEMADLFGQVSPISHALGVSIEEQAAAIALLTQKGMKPAKAITGYGRLLDRFLTKTGKDAAAVMESVGLDKDFFSAEYLSKKGLIPAMKELKDAVGDDPDLISKLFPNINAKLAAQSLLSSIDDFEDVYKEMLNPEDALENAFQEIENSIPRRIERIKGKIDAINTKFYAQNSDNISEFLGRIESWLDENEDRILEFMEDVAKGLAGILRIIVKIVRFVWENKGFFGGLFKVLVIIHLIVKAMDKFVNVTKNIEHLKETFKAIKKGKILANFSPKKILLIAIAIYAVIKAIRYLRKNWDRIKKEYPNIAGIVEFIGDALKGLGEILTKAVIPFIKEVWKLLKDLFGDLIKVLARIIDTLLGWIKGLAKVIAGFFKVVSGLILGLVTGDFALLEEGLRNIGEGVADIMLTSAKDPEWIKKLKEFKEWVQEPIDWEKFFNPTGADNATKRVLGEAGQSFKNFGKKALETFRGFRKIFMQAIKSILKMIVGAIATVVGFVRGLLTGDFGLAKDGFDMMGEGFADMWLEVYEVVNNNKPEAEIIDKNFKEFFEEVAAGKSLWEELRQKVEKFKETMADNEYLQIAREAWEQFSEWFKGMFSGLVNVVSGLLQIIAGVLIFILGLVTFNFERMEEGVKMATDGATQAWEGFEEIVRTLIPNPKINGEEVSVFKGLVESTKTAWSNLKKKIEENPIVGTITRVWKDDTHHEGRKAKSNRRIFGKKAGNTYKGTTNWKGGWTYLHERGGEVYDLPDGTRVYPHDRSVAMAYDKGYDEAIAQAGQNQGGSGGSSGNNIEIGGLHFYGDINNQGDIDEIGTQIATAVKKALANT